MKLKWSLFAGIILLIAGIIIRKTTGFAIEGLVMIMVGVSFKTYYIINKVRSGEYNPGYELAFLFIGLIMFLAGLYIKNHHPPFSTMLLIAPGLLLKVVFIILFIRKTRTKTAD